MQEYCEGECFMWQKIFALTMLQKVSSACRHLKFLYTRLDPPPESCQLRCFKLNIFRTTKTEALHDLPQNFCPPQVVPGRKKKPYVGVREGSARKRRNKSVKQIITSPENGVPVQSLIPVAHQVMKASETFSRGIFELMKVVRVKACRCCPEIHVGPIGHHIKTCNGPNNGARNGRHEWMNAKVEKVVVPVKSYHLKDRLARPVDHDKRLYYKRIPSIVELCIQAGVDMPEYPTLRKSRPIGAIQADVQEGRDTLKQANESIDLVINKGWSEMTNVHCKYKDDTSAGKSLHISTLKEPSNFPGSECIAPDMGLQQVMESSNDSANDERVTEFLDVLESDTQITAEKTLEAWTIMRIGVRKLMDKYPVKVCGYCTEVHVGPVGHKVRLCKAYKNQMRGGHHGWQQAALHDIIPHQYVWHVPDVNGPPLAHELRKYYGQVPAVVELCVQAGASIPHAWRPFMRLDVAIPLLEECDMVV
ncbi:hypothetical protein O6H91_18G009400 [Diphasiastrum complanatum]|uniref:Uncharacterized protein n=1 Tax=Diphasiastrum complanatum TaxID=34168 RepID=A0ACC2AZC6_DIPCM|nr:hypothetical protein O6H91_18G009400 [Diphasiastrum complanatum]